MWTECNIGGGEEIEGYEDGGPPTLCQPASQQGGGEEVKYPGRRSLEGVGGVLGAVGKFLVSLFTFYQGICLPFPVCRRLAGFCQELVFGREDGKGRVGGK